MGKVVKLYCNLLAGQGRSAVWKYCTVGMLLIVLSGIAFGQSTPVRSGVSEYDASHYTNVGNIRLTISNYGTIGSGFVGWPEQPSCEYPRGSRIEHLFLGGLWVGGIKTIAQNRIRAVSTAAVDISAVRDLAEGFEFTVGKNDRLQERSSLPESPYYSPEAISHQDFIATFVDTNTTDPLTGKPIPGHIHPLGLAVHFESYAWNYPFVDNFVILNYTIRNVTNDPIDSVYVGLWADGVVRNTNLQAPRGSAFFSAGGNGFLPELRVIYEWDAAGDNGLADSYFAVKFLGSSPLVDSVFFNNWQFRNTTGDQWNQTPQTDADKYERLRSSYLGQLGYEQAREILRSPSNRSQLLSVGPFPSLKPGDSINVVFAVICAKKVGLPAEDNEQTQIYLRRSAEWAQRTYNGTDVNGNNRLDSNEVDLNGDGSIVRYVLPTPPNAPKVRYEVSDSKVVLYWSDNAEYSRDLFTNRRHFEGYRIYRSDPVSESHDTPPLRLVAQFDIPNNGIFADNGFDAIRIVDQEGNPTRLYFEGDTTGYTYKMEFPNLLNGWIYRFALSAFSSGDPEFNIPSLESNPLITERAIIPGAPPSTQDSVETIGIFPNPYYLSAAWDRRFNHPRSRKIYFYNLPASADIYIYSPAGDLIKKLSHVAGIEQGQNIEWFHRSGLTDEIPLDIAGSLHCWDLITEGDLELATGLYLVVVHDRQTGNRRYGKFLVVK